jgi:hypothetical protein
MMTGINLLRRLRRMSMSLTLEICIWSFRGKADVPRARFN